MRTPRRCAARSSRARGAEHRRRAARRRRTARANATLGADGKAIAPVGAPPEVVAVIAAANEIVGKPYRYGGGHGDWEDSGYDCSGSESYALHGADLVSRPMNSSEFMSWGEPGEGAVDHQLRATVATPSSWSPACDSTRATTTRRAPARSGRTKMRPTDGYTVRHPAGSLVVLAVSHHRALFDDRPVAAAPLAEEEQRDQQADDADRPSGSSRRSRSRCPRCRRRRRSRGSPRRRSERVRIRFPCAIWIPNGSARQTNRRLADNRR